MIAAIQAALPEASIRTICATLGVSRSWWYATRARSPNETEQELVDRIEQIILRYPGYGYRRVTIALQQQGVLINHKRVRRLMRHHALLCQVKRAVATTQSQHPFGRVPNLIRGLELTGPGQLWVADLTYLHLVRETAFLACVLDAWSRRCIGWALGADLTAALSLAALEQAIQTQPPPPRADPPFGSGGAICQSPVRGAPAPDWRAAEHVGGGPANGQCPDRSVLQYAQTRGGVADRLPDHGRGPTQPAPLY
jgi:transposase InsO family protein